MVAQANPNGIVVETHYYADLCYKSHIFSINELDFAQSRDICGTACCHRYRNYISNGPNLPPTPSPPRYNKQGECEEDSNDINFGSCTRTCGPLD